MRLLPTICPLKDADTAMWLTDEASNKLQSMFLIIGFHIIQFENARV